MAAKSNLINMALCLTGVCLICSALLGGVYVITAEPIAKASSVALKASIGKVLPEGGTISDAKTINVGGTNSEYYVSLSGDQPVGYAIKSVTVGFGGPLVLMVGLTPDGVVYNTAVLSHSETPGLGAKCDKDEAFLSQFRELNPESKSLIVKKDGGDMDAITASTITSRAYILAVKNAVDAFKTINNE